MPVFRIDTSGGMKFCHVKVEKGKKPLVVHNMGGLHKGVFNYKNAEFKWVIRLYKNVTILKKIQHLNKETF